MKKGKDTAVLATNLFSWGEDVKKDSIVLAMNLFSWEKYDKVGVGVTAFWMDRESQERARRLCEEEGCWKKLVDKGGIVLWGVGVGLEVRPWNP